MRDGEVRGGVAEVGAQSRRPALELRERTREPLPARLRQLHVLVFAVTHLELAEALTHEQVFELGVLLEVELLVAELDPVERRNGDMDMARLDELAHVAVEGGGDERGGGGGGYGGGGPGDDPGVGQSRDVDI